MYTYVTYILKKKTCNIYIYICINMCIYIYIHIYIFVEMCGEVHNTQLGYDHACDPFSKWDAHARRPFET